MAAYGFCLQNNKYNSLRFKVWVDFNQDDKEREKAIQQKREMKEKKKLAKIAEKAARAKDCSESSEESEEESDDDDGLDNRVKK